MATVNVVVTPVGQHGLIECSECGPVGVGTHPLALAGIMHLGEHMLRNVTFVRAR